MYNYYGDVMSKKRNKEKLIRIILNQGSIDAKENYDDLIFYNYYLHFNWNNNIFISKI